MRVNTTMSSTVECGRKTESGGQLRSGKMPAPFACAIRIPPEHEHADQSGDEWNRAHPTNVKITPSGHAFEERRHPEPKNVTAAVTKEQTEGQNDHRRMSQRL